MEFDEERLNDPNYSSEDAYDDLEEIRNILHGAKRKINRSKLEKSDIKLEFTITL